MDKNSQLESLFNEMRQANLPLLDQSPLVPGEGNPDATVVFIGEAAGFHEARLQRPFVGQAGKLLDKLLTGNGMPRDAVWITNVVKARPPENRDPLPEEVETYRPYLDRELKIIQPRVIASLGRFAMNWFKPDLTISKAHGQPQLLDEGRVLFPLYHPAAALRSGKVLSDLTENFRQLVELVRKIEAGKEVLPGASEPEPVVPSATQNALF